MLFVFACKARWHNEHDLQCMPWHGMQYNMSDDGIAYVKFVFHSSHVFCRAAAVTVLGQSTSRAPKGGLLR